MPLSRHEPALALGSRVDRGPSRYEFHTADGCCSPDGFRPATLALLGACWDERIGRLLVPAANYGVVGCVLAGVADAVAMTETSARAAACCERNVAANGVDATVSTCAQPADRDEEFDTVAYAPKPYTPIAVGKQRVANALATLAPGGTLFVAGTTDTGLGRYEDCLADLAGRVETVHDGDARVVTATRPGTVDPPAFVEPREFSATVDGVALSLVSMPGTFSAGHLDHGTRLLLETATVEDGERVLDLCCGYGPVGAYAGSAADCDLWLTDDDAVATACAERTLAASGVDGTVVTADAVSGVADRRFDHILSNPPTHAGDGVLSALFSGMASVVASAGRATVVHHRSLDLSRHFGRFSSVERLATGDEHVVVRLEK
ncbi:methyltransferase [Haloarchaeobius iranensis]|uniref:16S rRNA (Guanine1207-N2)-methyltransferase n=1 Tax=Haloarchaeobius iranensis TaxID=996166 RepID=A0A1G9YGU3_9EURY|nr:methyltransferase [Haloarchaeobius iranensis]SDN08374.1 16S rRNA (guanine1207-N2)-methyltransferase [Haloarchaeobius iranensis]